MRGLETSIWAGCRRRILLTWIEVFVGSVGYCIWTRGWDPWTWELWIPGLIGVIGFIGLVAIGMLYEAEVIVMRGMLKRHGLVQNPKDLKKMISNNIGNSQGIKGLIGFTEELLE